MLTSTLLVTTAAAAQLMAAPNECPSQVLVSGQTICYEAGGLDTAENTAGATYTVPVPFEDSQSELCVKLDVTAELEAGGYDRVYVHFDDGLGATDQQCVVGDSPGDCTTLTGGGCATLPTASWNVADTYCFQPTPGATSVTVTVFVQPYDVLYNCGDCPPGGSPQVVVNSLAVTGCTGLAQSGCGDGVLDAGEACDDGNTLAGDGCDQACEIEPGAVCAGDLSACIGAGSCDALAPGDLAVDFCYATADDMASSPLSWTWELGDSPGPLYLHWDVEGGVELHDPTFDALWLSWSDDMGGGADVLLNEGDEIYSTTKTHAWSRGSLTVTPTAGATAVTATIWVATDSATSCQEPKVDQSYEPLTVHELTLSSCGVTVDVFDTLAEFGASVNQCYLVYDFNGLSDGDTGPFTGDGFSLDSGSGEATPLTVSAPIHFYDKPWGTGYGYLSTQASGDGTNALEPQLPGAFVSNSRLSIDFLPEPAKAIGMNIIDAGDWGGVMAIEGWRDGQLVFVDDDPGATGGINNYIVWKGFVFSEPVDRVVFFMIDPSDHFAIDNLVVVPQSDADADGVPDQCDCAPDDEDVAGSFPEVCDDGVDNDCDGLTDGEDQECGGGGTASCGQYVDVDFADDNGGWLTSGDQSWAWDGALQAWKAVGAANIDAVLESAPLPIPESACGGFEVTLELSGATEAPNDTVTLSTSVAGGPWTELDVLSGALSTQVYALAAQPGDAVSFRLRYQTDATGLAGTEPRLSGLSIASDSGDGDGDGVCDACDCAPGTPTYGFDCDADGDGWCAAAAGTLNADPAVAGCDQDAGGGSGTDCDDAAASANPGNAIEATAQCSDGLDNDCDGLTDGEDTADCPLDDCVDEDGDGYGAGTTCLGPDCDDTAATCTTDCQDVDGDEIADCADTCIDADGDGYGVGEACYGADCNDAYAGCTNDCTTDADGNAQPDCEQDALCVDQDGDGYGVGDACDGADCNDAYAECTTDCTDTDGDGTPDCADCAPDDAACAGDCATDHDGDGVPDCADCAPNEAMCAADCADADGDGTPDCADCAPDDAACSTDCADADGDGVPDCADCAPDNVLCAEDCSDADGNGTPDCAEGCDDPDGDGYGEGPGCAGPDCDEASVSCHTDCVTDVDEDGIPDCKDGAIVDPKIGSDVSEEDAGCECRGGGAGQVPWGASALLLFLFGWRRRARREGGLA